jgi:hypothetical protein
LQQGSSTGTIAKFGLNNIGKYLDELCLVVNAQKVYGFLIPSRKRFCKHFKSAVQMNALPFVGSSRKNLTSGADFFPFLGL